MISHFVWFSRLDSEGEPVQRRNAGILGRDPEMFRLLFLGSTVSASNVKRRGRPKTISRMVSDRAPADRAVSKPKAPTQSSSQLERICVLTMASCVSILLVLAAYFTNRGGSVDEIGLYNPTYMYVHYGTMIYPIHGYFDRMIVHPPVHYLLIGVLMRLGMTLYYAQATPTLVMALLCVWLVVRSPFTAPVKIGLLYGLWVSMAAFARFGLVLFGMRPEGHLGAAWLAALVLLESGRLRNWNLIELFGGTFLLAYASGLHYYAAPALAGAAVYMLWALISLRRRAWKPLLAMAAGGLLFGLPYVIFFVVPNLHAILQFVRASESGGGVRDVLQAHLDQYAFWTLYKAGNFWLQIPISWGIPLVLLSTPILLALPSTRGIALAALPLELFLLLSAQHKHAYYFIHEVALYAAAILAGSLTLADKLLTKLRLPAARLAGWIAFGLAIAISFRNLQTWQGDLAISLSPQVHEAEIARAAGRQILGPDATVATKIGPWFSSGGRYWHNPDVDVEAGPSQIFSDSDLRAYFSHFDAVVQDPHMSDSTNNSRNAGLLTWYIAGILRLRGFYFGQRNPDLDNLFFETKTPQAVTGFGLKNGQLYRFNQTSAGDHELIVLICSVEQADQKFLQAPLSAVMHLPEPSSTAQPRALVAFLAQRNDPVESRVPDAQVIQRIPGTLVPVDWRSMVNELRSNDPPMTFYRSIYQIPGFTMSADR